MDALQLLNSRLEVAQKFTEDFKNELQRCVKDYKAEKDSLKDFFTHPDQVDEVAARYQFPVPMIFTNHTAIMGNLFDRPFDLMISGEGKRDEVKKQKIEATYQYLKKKLDLKGFMNQTAWWFVLVGFCSAHVFYRKEGEDVPVYDEKTGEVLLDDEGKPLTRFQLSYDDPILFSGEPEKEYFSPESEFTTDGKNIPYYFREKPMRPEVVEKIYGEKVEPDATLETKAKNKKDNPDLKRCSVYFYYGIMDKESLLDLISLKKLPKGSKYDPEKPYYVVFTKKKVLYSSEFNGGEKQCAFGKWQGVPSEFFGFGVGKILRYFQLQKSIRRGQQLHHADIAAFPKPLVEMTSQVDHGAFSDPRDGVPVLYKDTKPEYLNPPTISEAVNQVDSLIDKDAQQAAGMLDIAAGNQAGGTVDTATGQNFFASELDKRMKLAKSNYAEFYKRVMILLFKQCATNWSEEKIVTIMDDEGNETEVTVTGNDLKDIDFDKDLDIDVESASANKDLLRSQLTELYNILKDDPRGNRTEVLKDLMRDGYGRKNPERYLTESNLEPGMRLTNPETGEMFVVDDSGQVVPQAEEDQTADPTGGTDIPSDQSALIGAAQQ